MIEHKELMMPNKDVGWTKPAPHTRFSDQAVREIRKMLGEGMSVYRLARQLECSETTIRDIKHGKSYRWVI
jgi:DNA-binding NarL/FixJ family response regulator